MLEVHWMPTLCLCMVLHVPAWVLVGIRSQVPDSSLISAVGMDGCGKVVNRFSLGSHLTNLCQPQLFRLPSDGIIFIIIASIATAALGVVSGLWLELEAK